MRTERLKILAQHLDEPQLELTDTNGQLISQAHIESTMLSELKADSSALARGSSHAGGLTQDMRTNIYTETAINQPHNTKVQYQMYVKHFIKWCAEHGHRAIPHTSRVAAFLYSRRIEGVSNTRTSKIETKATFDGNAFALSAAKEALEARYLWDLGDKISGHAPIQKMGQAVARGEPAVKRARGVDPLKNTIADFLTREEFELCTSALMDKGLDETPLKYGSLMKVMRQALYRGDDARRCRIADLFLVRIPKTAIGPDECVSLCILSKQGKANQMGKTEYGYMFRGRNPTSCAIGALALWLYYRYHVFGEAPPDLMTAEW